MTIARFAAVALLLAGVHQVSSAGADENWNDHLKVTATSKGGELRIVLEGSDGWYINTKFAGLKITLPDGLGDKSALGQADAKLEGTEHEGKAKKATFTVPARAGIKLEGSYKTVICSENSCSPPLKGSWTAK